MCGWSMPTASTTTTPCTAGWQGTAGTTWRLFAGPADSKDVPPTPVEKNSSVDQSAKEPSLTQEVSDYFNRLSTGEKIVGGVVIGGLVVASLPEDLLAGIGIGLYGLGTAALEAI